jgi:hypothetical protein
VKWYANDVSPSDVVFGCVNAEIGRQKPKNNTTAKVRKQRMHAVKQGIRRRLSNDSESDAFGFDRSMATASPLKYSLTCVQLTFRCCLIKCSLQTTAHGVSAICIMQSFPLMPSPHVCRLFLMNH